MTLYEYLQMTNVTEYDEITVWDKDYIMETYFYKTNGNDLWDISKENLAKLLNITEFSKTGGVTVNLAEIIESKLPQLKKAKLFIRCDIDNIMDDMENILAGNVSEEWLAKFVEVLNS